MTAGIAFMTASMASDKKMDSAYKAQQLSGASDHDYVHLMIPHHQGAVEMARAEVQYGQVPMMRAMAQMMITSQQQEIGRFQTWLSGHD